jgi:hypothetical protein
MPSDGFHDIDRHAALMQIPRASARTSTSLSFALQCRAPHQALEGLERQLAHQQANEIRGAYNHAAESWQERRADDAVVGRRVRPAKRARSCHQNECLRKSAFKVGLLPKSHSISSTCWCQGAPEVSAPLLVADVRSLS